MFVHVAKRNFVTFMIQQNAVSESERDVESASRRSSMMIRLVYFIGERANNTNDLCPTKNAEKGSDGVCRCLPGYQVTNNRRECG